MPIYAYRCSACGYENDYLQKVSDPLLTECPECGKSTFKKQVTAAGFQLKGTGWYVTDFRDNGKKAKTASKDESKTAGDKPSGDKASGDKASGDKAGTGSAGSSGDTASKSSSSADGAGASPAS